MKLSNTFNGKQLSNAQLQGLYRRLFNQFALMKQNAGYLPAMQSALTAIKHEIHMRP
ncbi:MAG: hypothetical protein ACFHVJ_10980 [Aestuariibacter sp.]